MSSINDSLIDLGLSTQGSQQDKVTRLIEASRGNRKEEKAKELDARPTVGGMRKDDIAVLSEAREQTLEASNAPSYGCITSRSALPHATPCHAFTLPPSSADPALTLL
jgi:hypothetical protein